MNLRPIATAPHERPVIVSGPSGYRHVARYYRSAFWSEERGEWMTESCDSLTDTHPAPDCWSELPANA